MRYLFSELYIWRSLTISTYYRKTPYLFWPWIN